MNRKLLAICILSMSAVVLMFANFFNSPVVRGDESVNTRDYQVVTARVQSGEGIYVLDNREGNLAVFTYDAGARALRAGRCVLFPMHLNNSDYSVRRDWTPGEIRALYDQGLLDLVFQAAEVHRRFHDAGEVQVCKLISVKTGACPEDCSYCSQSSRYSTGVEPTALMAEKEVLEIAAEAKRAGVSRVCLGAAWREVKDNSQFDRVLKMVRGITDMGLEVCCTLGMLQEDQIKRLEAAGLYAYNHNIDTSEQFYETIITTRKYADRLRTIEQVRKTNVTVCSGGIIGLGETPDDRMSMLQTLATMNPHPESVPINILSKVPGTPLADQADVPIWEVVKMIALARLLMPKSVVRLSAGRAKLSVSDQALCFLAGANSIFSSDNGQMLTLAVPSPKYDADAALMEILGLRPRPAFKDEETAETAGV